MRIHQKQTIQQSIPTQLSTNALASRFYTTMIAVALERRSNFCFKALPLRDAL